ncbi:ABC transporter ATP-binding protein, partial [Mesorhizobium sp. M7A.F.Ca.CA.001.13.1.1]|uniref:oligopeptide/dipeptide ABC transporter ATP-binding protein n=1 Tax=Mesorhizobium sp. M7A.F.Ca.CA.001.13.1.1 TaxID=2496728 RepID=UPI000FD1AB7D
EALKAVRISEAESRLKQFPHELSGGMRQRVMIAMALALEPDVLIADEPTTALDVTVQGEVLELLRDLQRQHGTSVILITHDMGVVAEMADRVIIMRHGRMVEEGKTADIFARPQAGYTRELLAAVPRIGSGIGRQESRSAETATPANVADVKDLHVRFDLHGGFFGRVTRRDVQMIFQDPYASLDPRMRVGDLVAEPLLIHGIASKEERSERVAALFERVGLSPDQMELYPHEFSGGQRQRVCIARALALRPKLIIADESVSALDVSVQARVLDLLKELQREFGVAYLFISHDMAVVENISDRVAVMYLGQIVEMGTRDQVFSNPRHPYTRRLIEAVPVPDPAQRRSRFARLDQEIPSATRRIGEAPLKLALRDVGNGHLVAVEG